MELPSTLPPSDLRRHLFRPSSLRLPLRSILLPPPPLPPSKLLASKRIRSIGGRGEGGGGGLVDENMVVLRRRIRELQSEEENFCDDRTAGWMEWEQRYYGSSYGSDVCEAVGLLQALLLSTRPAIAVGVGVAVAAGVPAAGVIIFVQIVGALGSILQGIHLG
ncbi:hypothetical protein AXF42_Ash005400 [Apostasia shenzhenica]|uniref:Uncharacterized protein n=1 Tax=Apostasia shenzhenica TaxID=1088818 RepID=A0A2I0B6U2_9ASPA|nr:hypothetical protein AXF42_Ash005400 [Apostasia shenzhenica]